MKTNDDFKNLDKAMSEAIMSSFKGQEYEVECMVCHGTGIMPSSAENELLQCINCFGEGYIVYEHS